jgi:hypothetical protein
MKGKRIKQTFTKNSVNSLNLIIFTIGIKCHKIYHSNSNSQKDRPVQYERSSISIKQSAISKIPSKDFIGCSFNHYSSNYLLIVSNVDTGAWNLQN